MTNYKETTGIGKKNRQKNKSNQTGATLQTGATTDEIAEMDNGVIRRESESWTIDVKSFPDEVEFKDSFTIKLGLSNNLNALDTANIEYNMATTINMRNLPGSEFTGSVPVGDVNVRFDGNDMPDSVADAGFLVANLVMSNTLGTDGVAIKIPVNVPKAKLRVDSIGSSLASDVVPGTDVNVGVTVSNVGDGASTDSVPLSLIVSDTRSGDNIFSKKTGTIQGLEPGETISPEFTNVPIPNINDINNGKIWFHAEIDGERQLSHGQEVRSTPSKNDIKVISNEAVFIPGTRTINGSSVIENTSNNFIKRVDAEMATFDSEGDTIQEKNAGATSIPPGETVEFNEGFTDKLSDVKSIGVRIVRPIVTDWVKNNVDIPTNSVVEAFVIKDTILGTQEDNKTEIWARVLNDSAIPTKVSFDVNVSGEDIEDVSKRFVSSEEIGVDETVKITFPLSIDGAKINLGDKQTGASPSDDVSLKEVNDLEVVNDSLFADIKYNNKSGEIIEKTVTTYVNNNKVSSEKLFLGTGEGILIVIAEDSTIGDLSDGDHKVEFIVKDVGSISGTVSLDRSIGLSSDEESKLDDAKSKEKNKKSEISSDITVEIGGLTKTIEIVDGGKKDDIDSSISKDLKDVSDSIEEKKDGDGGSTNGDDGSTNGDDGNGGKEQSAFSDPLLLVGLGAVGVGGVLLLTQKE